MRTIAGLLAASVLTLTAGAVSAQDIEAPMSTLEIAVACSPPPMLAPQLVGPLRVKATQDTSPRRLLGNRDLVVINGGTGAGVQLGQQFFVRRPNRLGMFANAPALGLSTLGWIRIVAVNDSTAIAMVDHACGGIIEDDYLTPYSRPLVPVGAERDETSGEPDFTSLARVLGGDEDRQAAGAGDFMLIDRGADLGLVPGTRMSLYRDVGTPGMPLSSIGEAIVISVGPIIALTRITRARDAILSGDYVAVRK